MDGTLLAQRIIAARERLAWSQKELARKAGLHPVMMNRLEKGVRPGLQAETVKRLALALGVSMDYLCGLTVETSHAYCPCTTGTGVACPVHPDL